MIASHAHQAPGGNLDVDFPVRLVIQKNRLWFEKVAHRFKFSARRASLRVDREVRVQLVIGFERKGRILEGRL